MLRFLLLTGVRISEAQQASPEAAQNGIWDIPGSLTKNGKPHRVYLTESAQAELPLPSCTPTNVQAWLKRWSIKQGIEDRFTPHDLRRTFATWLNESGTEPYVVEKCLAHAMAGVMAVYNRAEYWEQRQEAYQTMQDVVHSIVGEPAMY